MIRVDVKIEDHGLAEALAGLAADMEARAEMHAAMAAGVEDAVRGYLLEKNSRSPNTGFYAKASRSVQVSSDAEEGLVRIPHRGMALRYFGGRVDMKDRLLTLPTKDVPVRGGERMAAGEMGEMEFRPRKKDAKPNVRGYLLKENKLMYVLCEWTDHAPDPAAIPDDAALQAAARAGAEDYLAAARRERGLA